MGTTERFSSPGACIRFIIGCPSALMVRRQVTLFEDVALREKRGRLNAAVDTLNGRFGRGTIALAGAGIQKGWKLKTEMRSPPYTTDWDQLLVVR